MKKFLRRTLIGLALAAACLVLLLTAVCVYINWRGARAWAECQHDLAARGESLDWKKFVPPPIPDAENFAMAPLFVKGLAYRLDPKTKALALGPRQEWDKVLAGMIMDHYPKRVGD